MKFLVVILFIFFSYSFHAQYLNTDWGVLFESKSYPLGLVHLGKNVSVTSDQDGNVYVASMFRDTVTLAGVSNPVTLISNGQNDGVVAKFNSSGACVWAHKFGGTAQDFCNIISLTSDSSVIIGGGFSNQVDFDPSGNDSICNSSSWYDVFMLKLSSDGEFQWVRALKGTSNYYDCIHGLKENSNHEFVLAGEFSGTLDFDPSVNQHNLTGTGSTFSSYPDIFLAKYDFNGDLIWANKIGGSGPYDKAFDLDLDGDDNMLISGYFGSASMDMDLSADTSFIYNVDPVNYSTDVFLAKYDVNGNHLWSGSFGGPNSEYGNTVDVGPSGDIVICGLFNGNVDFDLTANTHFVNSNTGYLAYMAKYSPLGELAWVRYIKNLSIEEAAIGEGGTVFLAGSFNDTIQFDGQTRMSNGTNDCFIAELSPNGSLMWINSFGGPNGDVLGDIHLISDNEIVVGGSFKSLTDIDPSAAVYEFIGESTLSNFFFAKYSLGDLGLEEQTPAGIIIYPNPNTGEYLNIVSKEPLKEVELYDVLGKRLLISDSGSINLSQFENGEYFVRVKGLNGLISTHKLILRK